MRLPSRRIRYYCCGWAMLVLLVAVSPWHRAPPGAPPHVHTQLVGVAILAHLIMLSVWGGLMLHEYFGRRDQ